MPVCERLLKMELQMMVNRQIWVLGTKLCPLQRHLALAADGAFFPMPVRKAR